MPQIASDFLTFVAEQFPFALPAARRALSAAGLQTDSLKAALREELSADLSGLSETTPFVSAERRHQQEVDRFLDGVDGFFARAEIAASISAEERRWMLRGILLTRAVDNRLKQVFLSGELRYGEASFQGKGFRSTGQEAIYASALRLRRGPLWSVDGRWNGDVVAPLIRDLGVALAFTDDVAMPLNAQAGKSGPPM